MDIGRAVFFVIGILLTTVVFSLVIWYKLPEYNVAEVGNKMNECQSKITREQRCVLVAIPEPENEEEELISEVIYE